jgi:hypothetical protein
VFKKLKKNKKGLSKSPQGKLKRSGKLKMNYIARQITSLPANLPSCQTLVFQSGQWPDYPDNYPENIDHKKAVEKIRY